MGKRLILVLALAFVVGIAVAAYAEVQNVKVSGDIFLSAIQRRNFGLGDYENSESGTEKYNVAGFLSQVRVRVDADLTDNVSTTVRLLNERQWGREEMMDEGGNADVSIDLAYVTLKEFLYSPLTLTLGRQELKFGNALIIGDPDSNIISENQWVPGDLSLRKAFDAVRATLNYDPLVVDLIYAKIMENDVWWWMTPSAFGPSWPEKNDMDLWGINGTYDLKGLGVEGTGQLYFFRRASREPIYESSSIFPFTGHKDTVNVIGGLVSGKILEGLTGSIEYAYQFGKAAGDITGLNDNNSKRRAWALQVMLNYAVPIKTEYSPMIGMVYTRLSGDGKEDGTYKFWDPMFEDQVGNTIPNAIFVNSNTEVWHVKGSIKPREDLTLSAVYGYYRLVQDMDETDLPGPNYGSYDGYMYDMTSKRDLGHALDLMATYDYTEDVQIGLLFGLFNPGSAFKQKDDPEWDVTRNATQVIGSMKVTF